MRFSRFGCLFLVLVVSVLHVHAGGSPKTPKGPLEIDGLKALKNADPMVRYKAAQTLVDQGPVAKFAVPALREALADKNAVVRIKVVEALWVIDKTPATTLMPVLLDAFKHKSANVRAAAPRVIAMVGGKGKAGLSALEAGLQDKEFDVKVAVITALGDLGPAAQKTAGALLDVVKDKDFYLLEPFVGAALANLGDGALPSLTGALADSSADRRRLAMYALGSLGPKAKSAAPLLAKGLQNEDPVMRVAALRALGKIGPGAKSTLPLIEKALDDQSPGVRIEATLATWFISGQPTHIAVLVKAVGDPSVSVRENACQALAVMKAEAKDAVDPVAKLLNDQELRLRAIITLGEIGSPAATTVPALKKFLQDTDGDIQLRTAFAIWQITGDAQESLPVLEELLGTEKHYGPAIQTLGEMGPAALKMLPTLVRLYRDEEVAADRLALAATIKKIDPKAAAKLGIK